MNGRYDMQASGSPFGCPPDTGGLESVSVSSTGAGQVHPTVELGVIDVAPKGEQLGCGIDRLNNDLLSSLDAHHHKITRTLSIVKNRLHPAVPNLHLLSEV